MKRLVTPFELSFCMIIVSAAWAAINRGTAQGTVVSEFQAVTNGFAAEYGRNAGAVFNVVLKSGTNHLHGNLYEYKRNSFFHARDPFAQLDAQGHELFHHSVNWNQFGGTLGGPVYLPRFYNGKNRTFFFASWDLSLLHETIPTVHTVPTIRQRMNDLSEDPNVAQFGIYDPMTTVFNPNTSLFNRQPFFNPDGSLGTSIPNNRLDPVAVWYLNQYPLPNYLDPRQQDATAGGCLNLCNNFRADVGSGQTTHNATIKIDHQINDKNKFFAEWLFNPTHYTNLKLPWKGATSPIGGVVAQHPYWLVNQNAGVENTTTFSPTVVNDFQFRFEAYNAFNHQNLAIPNINWCLPPNPDGTVDVVHQFGCQFGRITDIQTDPRNLQFGLKFFF